MSNKLAFNLLLSIVPKSIPLRKRRSLKRNIRKAVSDYCNVGLKSIQVKIRSDKEVLNKLIAKGTLTTNAADTEKRCDNLCNIIDSEINLILQKLINSGKIVPISEVEIEISPISI